MTGEGLRQDWKDAILHHLIVQNRVLGGLLAVQLIVRCSQSALSTTNETTQVQSWSARQSGRTHYRRVLIRKLPSDGAISNRHNGRAGDHHSSLLDNPRPNVCHRTIRELCVVGFDILTTVWINARKSREQVIVRDSNLVE
jgi:hypothetical protein